MTKYRRMVILFDRKSSLILQLLKPRIDFETRRIGFQCPRGPESLGKSLSWITFHLRSVFRFIITIGETVLGVYHN